MSESKLTGDVKTLNGDRDIAVTVWIGVITISVFVLDWLTPLGYADWLLYFVPLMLTVLAPRLNPYMLAIPVTILMVVGFILSPMGIAQSVAIFNRILVILTLWVAAAILAHRNKISRTLAHHESRATEREVEASQYARSLLEASLDPLVTISVEGKITDVNMATEQVTGVSRDALIGSDFADYFTEPEKAREGYQQAFSQGSVTDYPLAIRHASGNVTDVLYNASVYRDTAGNVVGVFAAARDITKRKHAEEATKEASQYARRLIEASLDPLVTISVEGKITDVNMATEQVTGVSRDALIGSDFADYFTEPEKAREGYQQVFSQGSVTDYPLAIRHASGNVTDVLYNASVYRDTAGNVVGVFAAARDITERKLLDQALRVKNVELEISKTVAEAANVAKSSFLSSMSHELRTPLNAILGFAQLMESGTPVPTPVQQRNLGQILKAGWYLLELVDEILDLALIESGKVMLSLEPVSLSEVFVECKDMLDSQAQMHNINMTYPRFVIPCFIHADRTRTKQILINLLSNAIKYNKPGGAVVVEYTH